MSKKDVDDYFRVVCADYHDMVESLREAEEYAQTHMVAPEKLDEMKSTVDNVKNNYLRISYIMYLFDKPVNKKKRKWYEKTHKYNTEQDLSVIQKENKEAINGISLK